MAPEKQNAPDGARSVDAAFAVSLPVQSTARELPRTGTARSDVLAALRHGQKLTSNDGLKMFGTSRLAAIIHVLRGMGWNVQTEMIDVATRRGESHVARYYLADEAKA